MRTADRSPKGYEITEGERQAAEAEPWLLTPSDVAALLRPLGWVADVGGTSSYVHRRTLMRLSFDLEFWPASLRALTQAALVIARADADARAKGKEGQTAGPS